MDAHRRKTKELGRVILAKTSIMIIQQVSKIEARQRIKES